MNREPGRPRAGVGRLRRAGRRLALVPALFLLGAGDPPPPPRDPVAVELFVMSQCPYGVAAEREVLEAVSRLQISVDFRLNFIARDRLAPGPAGRGEGARADGDSGTSGAPAPRAGSVAEGRGIPDLGPSGERCEAGDEEAGGSIPNGDPLARFTSLHGPEEVLEDARQVVVAHRWPDRLAAYLLHRAGDYANPRGFAASAIASGIDPDSLDTMARSGTGAGWLGENLGEARRQEIRASPTLFIGGAEYRGPFRATPLTHAIAMSRRPWAGPPVPECEEDGDCQRPGYEATCEDRGRPEARCVARPPVSVPAFLIFDSLCEVCPRDFLVARARELFPGLAVSFLDASSDSGRSLAAELKIRETPALVFDERAAAAPGWSAFRRRLRPAADRFVFDASYLDTASYPGRPRHAGRLDVFIAGRHRESLRAVRAVRRMLEHSGRNVEVGLHFVAERDSAAPWLQTFALAPDPSGGMSLRPTGREPRFVSFRGPAEIEENRRLLCLLRGSPSRFDRYVDRTIASTDSTGVLPDPWTVLLRLEQEESGFDLAALNACVTDTASAWDLLAAVALPESLGVSVTPSFLIENRVRLTGLTYESLLAVIRELDLGIDLPPLEDLLRRRHAAGAPVKPSQETEKRN